LRIGLNGSVELLDRLLRIVLGDVEPPQSHASGHVRRIDRCRLGEHLPGGFAVPSLRLNLPEKQVGLWALRGKLLSHANLRQGLSQSAKEKQRLAALEVVGGRLVQSLGHQVEPSQSITRPSD